MTALDTASLRRSISGGAGMVGVLLIVLLIAGEARDAVSTVVGVTHGHRPEATT